MDMATTATPTMHIATTKPCISASRKVFKSSFAVMGTESRGSSCTRLSSSYHISSKMPLSQSLTSTPRKFERIVTKAMSEASELKPLPGLPIDLRGWTFLYVF